ncbi:Bud-site selection protein [Clavulina sp. PMI_390]|nr:Bud-site selection protein [Clavulina sp. PMI_390]
MSPDNISAQAGQKRKRPEKKTKPARAKATPPLEEVLRGKLHHGVKEAKAIAKKAKDFEMRRAIKKLKSLRKQASQSTDTSLATAEAELEVLKTIDHESIALTALHTKLNKDHLSKIPAARNAIENVLPPNDPSLSKAPNGNSALVKKVESRLLSAKVLADGIKSIIDSLRAIAEPSTPNVHPVSEDGTDSSNDSDDDEDSEEEEPTPTKAQRSMGTLLPEDYDDDDDGLVATASSDEDDDDMDIQADAAGWESGSVSSAHSTSRPPKRARAIAMANSDSDSEDSDESDEAIDPAAIDYSGEDEDGVDDDGRQGANRFLPSLQVGFTRGDDSDAESWSGPEVEAPGVDKVRKNRRGQRARKAIWEKKFGRNANHVKKQREEERAANEAKALAAKARAAARLAAAESGAGDANRGAGRGRGERRGASMTPSSQVPTRLDGGWKGGAENRNAAGRGAGGLGRGRGSRPAESKRAAPGHSAPKSEEKLHPSWEAKRKLKEKEQIGILPAQGKKIVF